MMQENEDETERFSVFDAQKIPKINIHDYLQRVAKYSRISLEAAVIALIYVDRLILENEHFLLSEKNVHKFVKKNHFSCDSAGC